MNTEISRPPTLSQIVSSKLREEILKGVMQPGQQLSEPELSARYGVSRGTIREGLRAATADGLVEILPHRGARVVSLTPKLVHETYSLRRQLERFAVQEAWKAGAYDNQFLTSLEAQLACMQEAQNSGIVHDQIVADYDFHWSLCSASGHSLLLKALQEPQWLTRLCMISLKHLVPDLPADAQRHFPILEGLRVDLDKALSALEQHLQETEHLLLESVDALTEGDLAPPLQRDTSPDQKT